MSIDVRELSFAYGRRQVLRNVTFRAEPGQLVAVLGPNGAGKSTLFRCILGFLPRYRGDIALCGHALRSLDRRALARLAAYIPQTSAPVYNYTVRDTVLMGADPFHAPGRRQQETADRALEQLGIQDLWDRGVNEISGGERQLALIARAMAQQARILLMDEPTASLDYGNQFRLLRQVRALADSGYTVLLSTHDPEHALRFATHVLALHGGTVAACGPVEEMLTRDIQSAPETERFERVLMMQMAELRKLGAVVVITTRLTSEVADLLIRMKRMGPNVRLYYVTFRTDRPERLALVGRLQQAGVEVNYVTPQGS